MTRAPGDRPLWMDWLLPTRGGRPLVMGALNATPDSFSGDGRLDVDRLVALGRALVAAGADILDVGGESTHPSAPPVDAAEELRRIRPVIERLVENGGAPVSVDTTKAVVAEAALAAGAVMVNDVSGRADPNLYSVVARHGAWLIVMHNGWTARRDAASAAGGETGDVVDEVARVLGGLTRQALAAGVPEERLIVDPGLGFGKTPRESLELLRRTGELRELLAPLPLLVGPSRKGFIGRVLGLPVGERLEGTLACVAIAAFGGADLIRVHDVAPAVRVARMAWAVRGGFDAALARE